MCNLKWLNNKNIFNIDLPYIDQILIPNYLRIDKNLGYIIIFYIDFNKLGITLPVRTYYHANKFKI